MREPRRLAELLLVGLQVEVDNGAFIARPKRTRGRHRYSLRELLRGATPDAMRQLNADTAWAREGESVGREV